MTAKVGGATLIREVNGGNGYASQSSTLVHLGLGAATRIDELEVRWPSGLREKVTVPTDRLSYLKEGSGVVSREAAGFARARTPRGGESGSGSGRPRRPS